MIEVTHDIGDMRAGKIAAANARLAGIEASIEQANKRPILLKVESADNDQRGTGAAMNDDAGPSLAEVDNVLALLERVGIMDRTVRCGRVPRVGLHSV